VVTAGRFNRLTNAAVVVPITTGGNFARNIGFAVDLANAGTNTVGLVRCDQPRTIDLVARGARRIESVPEAIMDDVLAKIATLFKDHSVVRCPPFRSRYDAHQRGFPPGGASLRPYNRSLEGDVRFRARPTCRPKPKAKAEGATAPETLRQK